MEIIILSPCVTLSFFLSQPSFLFSLSVRLQRSGVAAGRRATVGRDPRQVGGKGIDDFFPSHTHPVVSPAPLLRGSGGDGGGGGGGGQGRIRRQSVVMASVTATASLLPSVAVVASGGSGGSGGSGEWIWRRWRWPRAIRRQSATAEGGSGRLFFHPCLFLFRGIRHWDQVHELYSD
uniref:Uncharacterized protein n=1 Tax=Oryza nivara TaxID=4536 RepID=A0A0E0IMH3_ORYNI